MLGQLSPGYIMGPRRKVFGEPGMGCVPGPTHALSRGALHSMMPGLNVARPLQISGSQ